MGGQTDEGTVNNMCLDAFYLYLLGYKDADGNGIRRLSAAEVQGKTKKVTMQYHHYTAVPKGWQIPVEDRPSIPRDTLASLEKGIEAVRQKIGEREAIY